MNNKKYVNEASKFLKEDLNMIRSLKKFGVASRELTSEDFPKYHKNADTIDGWCFSILTPMFPE